MPPITPLTSGVSPWHLVQSSLGRASSNSPSVLPQLSQPTERFTRAVCSGLIDYRDVFPWTPTPDDAFHVRVEWLVTLLASSEQYAPKEGALRRGAQALTVSHRRHRLYTVPDLLVDHLTTEPPRTSSARRSGIRHASSPSLTSSRQQPSNYVCVRRATISSRRPLAAARMSAVRYLMQ